MANVETATFPYAANGIGAPYTDGIVMGLNPDTGSVYIPFPGEMTEAQVQPEKRGKLTDYFGNTTCVDSYTTGHPVFAGDF